VSAAVTTIRTTLATAPEGAALTLVRSAGTPEVCRRLATLGLRRGAEVRVLQSTVGGGRVVGVGGARIALDRAMLQGIEAEVTGVQATE